MIEIRQRDCNYKVGSRLHGLPGNYSIVGGRGLDSGCLTAWVSFPPSPSTLLRCERRLRCLRRREAHGMAASSVVAFENLKIDDSETND